MPADDTGPILLDACVCINLAAVMPLGELERHIARPIRLVEQAAAEAMFLYDLRDGRLVKIGIDLSLVQQVSLAPDELDTYVLLAGRLDDGEAASLAAAQHRLWSFATDDRTARNAAATHCPAARLLSTAQVLRSYAEAIGLRPAEIGQMLQTVEKRASFTPPPGDPDFRWWREACK